MAEATRGVQKVSMALKSDLLTFMERYFLWSLKTRMNISIGPMREPSILPRAPILKRATKTRAVPVVKAMLTMFSLR